MTDAELWAAAWKELALTTDAYPKWKSKGFPDSSHWAKAKKLGDQIGQAPPPPPPPPSFTLTSSLAGGSLAGPVEWVIRGSVPLAKVEFFIDGVLKSTEFSSPYQYGGDTQVLDPATLSNGTHALKAVATASDGRTAEISFSVTVANTPPPPPPPPPPVGRVDLSTKASNLVGMISWLAANKQPAFVPSGSYSYNANLLIPAGVDLLFQDATLLPSNPATSALFVTGAGTKLAFKGACRIGQPGARNSRRSQPEACGLVLGRDGNPASNFNIHADDLIVEGVAGNCIFSYRGSNTGVVTGKITCRNSGADAYHITDRSHHLDFAGAELRVEGAGDDLWAVVSYKDNGGLVTDIHWGKLIGRDGQARGITVVGGKNVIVESFDIDGTAAASIYLAAEGSYNTYGVDGVTIKAGKARRPNTQGIHNCSVLAYSSVSGQTVQNCAVTGDFDPAWTVADKTGSYPISNVKVNGQTVS